METNILDIIVTQLREGRTIDAIKLVREVTPLGWRESKEFVELLTAALVECQRTQLSSNVAFTLVRMYFPEVE